MIFSLDASVFVSAFQKTEKHNLAAKEILAKISSERISLVSHALFFFEILSSMQRKTGDSSVTMKAMAIAKSLPAAKYVTIDQRLYASQESFVALLGLKGADAIYVAIANRYKAPLITFDQEILTRAERCCIPAEKFLTIQKKRNF